MADENQQPPVVAQNAEAAHVIMPSSKDIQMRAFTTESNPDETGRLECTRWHKELDTRFRYFKITEVTHKVDAINIYGGEHIRELIDTLPNRPQEAGDAYQAITAKLNHYFTPMVNADSARAKLERISQRKGESIAQYYVRIRMQAAKCEFPDIEDAIRSKLLQTMKDGKLRREAMIKRYILTQLLEHAANKEDIDRQAHAIENADKNREVKE